MGIGKFVYWTLWFPMITAGFIMWFFSKTIWTLDLAYNIAKDLHDEIKDF